MYEFICSGFNTVFGIFGFFTVDTFRSWEWSRWNSHPKINRKIYRHSKQYICVFLTVKKIVLGHLEQCGYFPHVFVYQWSVRERESCLVVIALGYYNRCWSLTSPESEVDTAYRDQGNGNLTPVRKLLDKLIRSQLKKIQQQIEFSQWITTANVWSLKWQE